MNYLAHVRFTIIIFISFSFFSEKLAKESRCSILKTLKTWNDINYANFTIIHAKGVIPITLNFTVDIKKKLPIVLIYLNLFLKTKQRTYVFVNNTIDMCKTFEGKEIDPMAYIILGGFRNIDTFFKSCPVEKGFYYIGRFQAQNSSTLNLVIPKGVLYIKMVFMIPEKNRNKPISTIDVSVDFDPKRNRNGC